MQQQQPPPSPLSHLVGARLATALASADGLPALVRVSETLHNPFFKK
jgi:hypothetical protein